jgi:hypothetical protein
MWPSFLDLSAEECAGRLRRLGEENKDQRRDEDEDEDEDEEEDGVTRTSWQRCARLLLYLFIFLSELLAYSSVICAFRAQGDLSKERRKILADLSTALNVPPDRHKTEVRRAVNDEQLATIARR